MPSLSSTSNIPYILMQLLLNYLSLLFHLQVCHFIVVIACSLLICQLSWTQSSSWLLSAIFFPARWSYSDILVHELIIHEVHSHSSVLFFCFLPSLNLLLIEAVVPFLEPLFLWLCWTVPVPFSNERRLPFQVFCKCAQPIHSPGQTQSQLSVVSLSSIRTPSQRPPFFWNTAQDLHFVVAHSLCLF